MRAAAVLIFFYLIALLALTFLPLGDPQGTHASTLNLVPLKTIGHALRRGADSHGFLLLVGNLVAFVPLGFLVPMLFRRWSLLIVLAGAVGLSLAIEGGQYAASRALGVAYRSADVDDVILNVLGALAGYALFVIFDLVRSGRSTNRPAHPVDP